jgi:hypothetical protein
MNRPPIVLCGALKSEVFFTTGYSTKA